MSLSEYWVERARISARRQQRLYGLDIPRTVRRLLEEEAPEHGLADITRLAVFTGLGPARGRLRLFLHRLADRDTPAQLRKIESLARDLRARLSGSSRVATDIFERRNYSRDMARVPPFLEKTLHRTRPLLIVRPCCEEDVAAALAFASKRRLPVFPRGVSSSAFGGSVPTRNGMVLDMSGMDGIIAVDPARLTARVQAGVRWSDLAARLDACGLALLTAPSSRFSTVGGWASTGGLGIGGFGHGHFSRAVQAARVALMDGSVFACRGADGGAGDFLGTEGQLGIFTELTLSVRPKPAADIPGLACFPDPGAAFEFIDRLVDGGHRPSHVVFFDRERMAEENRLFRDRTGREQPIVEEREAVLVHFDDPAAEVELAAVETSGALPLSHRCTAARYLWAERFFPLKAQRLGPGLLASEVVLRRSAVPGFIDRARGVAARFGVRPGIEAIVSRLAQGGEVCVVIVSFHCDPARKPNYLLRLLLVQVLMQLGVRMGGRPYGLGIWNAPFAGACYPAGERRRLARRKEELDPHHLLNPNKFLAVRTRFFNIPALLFWPPAFRAALRISALFAPIMGFAARLGEPEAGRRWEVPAPDAEEGARLLTETALRCTSCGSCISSCPAYLLTHDERVTGRAKLRMAESWLGGEEIAARELHTVFQCLHCGLCEEICQTRLPLRDCYKVLERRISDRHGMPTELIGRFVERLDSDREPIRRTFGLDLPEWSPEGSACRSQEPRSRMEARP